MSETSPQLVAMPEWTELRQKSGLDPGWRRYQQAAFYGNRGAVSLVDIASVESGLIADEARRMMPVSDRPRERDDG
jgi:hypothetical protein